MFNRRTLKFHDLLHVEYLLNLDLVRKLVCLLTSESLLNSSYCCSVGQIPENIQRSKRLVNTDHRPEQRCITSTDAFSGLKQAAGISEFVEEKQAS